MDDSHTEVTSSLQRHALQLTPDFQRANISRLNATNIQPTLPRPTIKRKVGYVTAEDEEAEAEIVEARQRMVNMRMDEMGDNVLQM